MHGPVVWAIDSNTTDFTVSEFGRHCLIVVIGNYYFFQNKRYCNPSKIKANVAKACCVQENISSNACFSPKDRCDSFLFVRAAFIALPPCPDNRHLEGCDTPTLQLRDQTLRTYDKNHSGNALESIRPIAEAKSCRCTDSLGTFQASRPYRCDESSALYHAVDPAADPLPSVSQDGHAPTPLTSPRKHRGTCCRETLRSTDRGSRIDGALGHAACFEQS